jgi:membrane-associated phospholipid phosphatase
MALQRPRLQGSEDLKRSAHEFAFAGGPGPFLAGASLYLAGRITREPRIADAAVHTTEAVLLAATITGILKGVSGRALPSANVRDPGNFQFGRGFHDGNGPFVSFPSGHAAASFAMAAALTEETARWSPRAGHIVGPIAYAGASLVGLARLYQNVHWASDLPLATAIGIWSGRTVVMRSHAQRQPGAAAAGVSNALLETLRSTTVVPAGGGRTAISWSLPLDLGSPFSAR